ncbi:MAG: aminotransferase class III-fold pyridoxal phosphate-dependent enzyme [Myxococcales bacterium]|nr:aminotransferase class III-fold pyridoxal phosphate-dependent enzyme [Myxococcales bacterium]
MPIESLIPAVRTELPGPKSRELMARGALDMQSGYRALVVDDAKSRGVFLVDADGNVLLDLFANFALGALGYNHESLLRVARSEAFVRAAVNPTSTPFVTTPSWFDVLDGLARFAPAGMGKIYCVDAGGEGVEAALKVAFIAHGERRRVSAGLPKNPLELEPAEQARIMDNAGSDAVVVSFTGSFHGRGLGPLSATHSKLMHKADLPAFPWPTCEFPVSRWPLERYADENAAAEARSLAQLERVLDGHVGKVAAILVEPIQSEGGDRHASGAFFRAVQQLAAAAGAALVLDEVQTGVGITGSYWAHEQLELPRPPELMTFGKKMQMGGFFVTDALAVTQFGRMYQTRNGDRGRGMLGLATLETIEKEGLLAHVRDTGAYFLAQLEGLAARHPHMTEPRGRGFLLAFDLPSVQARDEFLKRAMRRGVFASYTGVRSVRLRPHLITSQAEVDLAIAVFDAALAELG